MNWTPRKVRKESERKVAANPHGQENNRYRCNQLSSRHFHFQFSLSISDLRYLLGSFSFFINTEGTPEEEVEEHRSIAEVEVVAVDIVVEVAARRWVPNHSSGSLPLFDC